MTRRRLPAPRWETPLPAAAVGSWGPLVVAFARRELGLTLDRWQERAIWRALAVNAAGRLVHREYLVSTARQNGKTAIVRAIIGWALTTAAGPAWELLYGLAHTRAQARIPYAAVMADLAPLQRRLGHERAGGLALTRYLGIRSAVAGWRREYHVASRDARDAIRGYSVDLGLFDEVRTQRDEDTYAALKPTMTARPDPLLFEISTAGDERSILLRRLWERGRRILEGAEPAEGFGMTWYAADETDAPDDPRAWAKASPAMAEGRIDPASIRDELAGLTPATFRQERLNLWSDAADEWLPAGVWSRAAGAPPLELGERVVLAVEADPSWVRASVAVAVAAADAPAFVGIAADLTASPGATVAPAELLEALATATRAWAPALVVYARTGATARHVEAWAAEADIPSMALAPADLRAASELFRSELIGGRLMHADDPLLGAQARRARPSAPLAGGGWYFSVRESAGAIDAIRAAAWAAWGALAPEAAEPQAAIF
jgi:hypothetical protein